MTKANNRGPHINPTANKFVLKGGVVRIVLFISVRIKLMSIFDANAPKANQASMEGDELVKTIENAKRNEP
jgi:hypothetical protein